MERLLSYRNAGAGLVHGIQRNTYRFESVTLFDNAVADLWHQALDRDDPGLAQHQGWSNLLAGHLLIRGHAQSSQHPVRFLGAHLGRVTVDEAAPGTGIYELHADIGPADFEVVTEKSLITVVRSNGSSFTLRPDV